MPRRWRGLFFAGIGMTLTAPALAEDLRGALREVYDANPDLQAARAKGELAVEPNEAHAWAIMGMNVFLGLRFGVYTAQNEFTCQLRPGSYQHEAVDAVPRRPAVAVVRRNFAAEELAATRARKPVPA